MGSPGTGGYGKVGGGKVPPVRGGGGTGKGKGKGKGKGGGGGPSGHAVFCFSKQVLDTITAAFQGATKSTGLKDGCVAGLWKVTLDATTAQHLLATVALGLNLSICPGKKKGKGKGKGKSKGKTGLKLVGKTKIPVKGRKAG